MSTYNNIFSNFKKDILSGLIVFLIALPLCLGIAQASGAPLFSGVVAGIVGGIVIGFFSQSNLSVSGPAAGLVAIVLVGIAQAGSFQIFLCATIIAGVLQLILGFIRAGSIASYFPTNVIEGMLAGIGLTIIIKQLPEALGLLVPGEAGISDAEDGFSFKMITDALSHIHPGAVVISVISLGILVSWQYIKNKKIQLIPSGLLVVILGTLLNYFFTNSGSTLQLHDTQLVSLPVPENFSDFFGQFALPDFNGFSNPEIWKYGVIIAIVASIETLLCIEATDKLDPLKRYTSGDVELKAQGIGNIISGFIGGLPITSVIVRSSANINAGGRTKLATITHGLLLLVCVASIPVLLNMIPKATLAAILIYTGYRLCKPAIFVHIWKDGGLPQFIPFAVTAVAVVSLDLLKGVGIGMAISIFYLLRQKLNNPLSFKRSSYSNSELIQLILAQEVTFLNKATIKKTLANLPENSNVIIDASKTVYIDYDVLDLIRDFQNCQAPDKNIKLSLVGFKNIYNIEDGGDGFILPEELVHVNEVPRRTAGNHRKLLKQLQNKDKITVSPI